jgi:hypothetical protein
MISLSNTKNVSLHHFGGSQDISFNAISFMVIMEMDSETESY